MTINVNWPPDNGSVRLTLFVLAEAPRITLCNENFLQFRFELIFNNFSVGVDRGVSGLEG